jgi:gamma-glutamylcyclotransferase (GGCT)/AIG2-like uncharacterized protein YtfP
MNKPDEQTMLFVYGSLMDPDRRQEIIGRRVDTVPATIHDYELGRARDFFIRERPGRSTEGLLLLNLTPEDFRLLDIYEEVPRLYTREKVEVFDERGDQISCWVYLPSASTQRG